jgi:IMP dehydrogenase
LPASTEGIELKREIAEYTDLFFTDVAEFWKEADIMGVKTQMEVLQTLFVLGNIGTYEAAEDLLTRDFPEEMFVGIKVGMGSGSICSTTIQTGVGAPTLFATAQVADAIADYNSKIALIADGGFKYPGDVVKSLAVGADMIMSGHFFAGCTESPGYVDEISGRKVKVYRGMGSAEARSVGSYAEDRYVPNQKKLVEGVSGYIPFTGPVGGKLESLGDSLRNGLIYAGAADMVQAKAIRIGRVTYSGQAESAPHDLIGRT